MAEDDEAMPCGKCGKPLSGTYYVEDDGAIYCEQCHITGLPNCFECKIIINEDILEAMGENYHRACFVCKECRVPLAGTGPGELPRFHQKRGKPVCAKCNSKPELLCLVCMKKSSEDMIVVSRHSMSFHIACLKCDDCDKPINPDSHFIAVGNALFLPACYEKFIVGERMNSPIAKSRSKII